MNKRPEGKGIERVLPPLFTPFRYDEKELIIIVTCFLETGGMRRCKNGPKRPSYPDREFEHLKQDIETFRILKPSKFDIDIELIYAVNGFLTEDHMIKYLNDINDTYLQDKVHLTVFQRPNIGWQYGAAYDVFQKHRHTEVGYYMMKEVDRHLKVDYWYDILNQKMMTAGYSPKSGYNEKICWVGGVERPYRFKPHEYAGPLTENIWRDKNYKPIKNPTKEITLCVKPHYYFLSPDFLHNLDYCYGNFTDSIGSSYELDGIVYGEHCFCQRAKELGYRWIQFTDSDFMESHGAPLYPTPIEEK